MSTTISVLGGVGLFPLGMRRHDRQPEGIGRLGLRSRHRIPTPLACVTRAT